MRHKNNGKLMGLREVNLGDCASRMADRWGADDERWAGDASSIDDDDIDGSMSRPAVITDPETWMDYWSEELVTLWHGLLEQRSALGAGAILDSADFPTFAQFCWEHSSGRPPIS